MEQQFEYFVMDGRARFDTDSATVLEACGRKRPSDRYLKRDWGDMDAVLVRAPVTADNSGGGVSCGDFEYLRDI